ncbi:ribokinase [Tatumella citrea]|uniref:Ribokinase n=1 Tax=Tatumella citrea TaxID=53336 RepID=A0A1Y0L3X9_TATCI|nr:ribokinase [Tatumella citrea]ARU92724.1 ribokinase [Tatumella citrea]ARU96762.1 ribokinase [Tatumella citrea]
MFQSERRQKIYAWLEEYERATVTGLAEQFGVTKETIRSDLNALAAEGRIERCHGGATVIRRSLNSRLIAESGETFEVLLARINHQQQSRKILQGEAMNGKVCILGSFNVDIVARVERFPKGGESLLAKGSSLGPGGKGANQALAASCAGAKVHFVSKVGSDQFSQFAFDHLTSSDIHSLRLWQSENEPTGNAIIYVSEANGENMIAIYPGANKTLTSSEIADMAEDLADSEILLVQLENNFDATLNAIRLAKELSVRVVLNPAPVSEEIISWLPMVDILTPNETEASVLSGIEVKDVESAKQAARKIADLGARQIIITMGSRGALLYDGQQFQHIPSFPALSVDTTGAGDAFNGAFVAALAAGESEVQAATFASAFASLAVEREGASNMPSREQAVSRLSRR